MPEIRNSTVFHSLNIVFKKVINSRLNSLSALVWIVFSDNSILFEECEIFNSPGKVWVDGRHLLPAEDWAWRCTLWPPCHNPCSSGVLPGSTWLFKTPTDSLPPLESLPIASSQQKKGCGLQIQMQIGGQQQEEHADVLLWSFALCVKQEARFSVEWRRSKERRGGKGTDRGQEDGWARETQWVPQASTPSGSPWGEGAVTLSAGAKRSALATLSYLVQARSSGRYQCSGFARKVWEQEWRRYREWL